MTSPPTPHERTPKRRWHQYSMRTCLLLVTSFCIWFGWLSHKAREQREAVAEITKKGGDLRVDIYYDYQIGPDGAIISDAEPPGPLWLRSVFGVDFMSDVVRVTCISHAENVDLSVLTEFHDLQYLFINCSKVSDLGPLARLKNLSELTVWFMPVNDLTSLSELSNLEVLRLHYTGVTDVAPLSEMRSLRRLQLDYSPVSDVTSLAALDDLEQLFIFETHLGENEINELRRALPNCHIARGPE